MLDIDSDAAAIVAEMFARVAAGAATRSVSYWLASLPEEVRQGRRFGASAVRNMLSARVYVRRHEDGERGNWPVIVGDDMFEAVQAVIASHQHAPRQATGTYLLTGLIRCTCSVRMTGGTGGAVIPPDRRYRCNGAAMGAGRVRCNRVVSCAAIDGQVLEATTAILDGVVTNDASLRAALRQAWRALSQPADDITPKLRTHEQVAARSRDRIKRLALLYADGEIDRDGYDLGRQQAQADLEAAEVEMTRLLAVAAPSRTLPPLDHVLQEARDWHTIVTGGDVAEQRNTLKELIDVVVPERLSYGKWRATITWTPLGAHLHRLAERVARVA